MSINDSLNARWVESIEDLAVLYAEMRDIHQTPAKEQTPAQLARLAELRKSCQAVGALRYEMARQYRMQAQGSAK